MCIIHVPRTESISVPRNRVSFDAAKQHMSRHYQHMPRKLGGNFSYESELSHETGHMQAPTLHALLPMCDLRPSCPTLLSSECKDAEAECLDVFKSE